MRKKIKVLLCLLLFFNFSVMSFASPNDTSARKGEIEQMYGITITVEKGYLDEIHSLDMLERNYRRFPDGLIKEITDYYKQKGIDTEVRFQYKDTSLGGSFDLGTKAYINYYVNPITFDDWAISHEMGHYLHKYLETQYGKEKLKNEWTLLNGDYQYNSNWNETSDGYLNIFARDYGTKSYSEDFATVIELLGSKPDYLRNRLLSEPNTPFSQKIDFLNRVLVTSTNSIKDKNMIWDKAIPEKPSSWAKHLYEEALAEELVPLTDKTAGLYTSPITRDDFCNIIGKLIEKETKMSLTDFTSSQGQNSKWYYYGSISPSGEVSVNTNYPFEDCSNPVVFNLNSLYIVSGDGNGIFNPEGDLTREQAAQILYNVATLLKKDINLEDYYYSDSENISNWAKSAVNYVSNAGIMTGKGNNQFSPKSKYSYEQAYITVLKFFKIHSE